LRTSAAASRPSCTSCSGVYLFFGTVIFVCANGMATCHTRIAVTLAVRIAPRSLRAAWAGREFVRALLRGISRRIGPGCRRRVGSRLRRRAPDHSRDSQKGQSQCAMCDESPAFRLRWCRVENLPVRIDLLPAANRIRRAGRPRSRVSRNGIGGRHPAREKSERLRTAHGTVLVLVDLFAIQAKPGIHQPHVRTLHERLSNAEC